MSTEELFDHAAAELTSALEREVICQVVQQHIEEEVPVTVPSDFWNAVVDSLRSRGYQRTTGEVQFILNDSRKKRWAVPDARKYIDRAKRKAARLQERESNAATYAAPPRDGRQYMAQQALKMLDDAEKQSYDNMEEDEEVEDGAAASITMVMR